jgi:hypothetical protein
MRPATPEEAAADYVKREAALDAAIEHGIVSTREAERYRADLAEFAGYDRPAYNRMRRLGIDPEPDVSEAADRV